MLVTWNAALVRVWAFGEFRVEYWVKDGSWKAVEPHEWGGNAHSRHVLRYLLLYGRSAGRGTLMNAIWPGSDSIYLDDYLSKAVSNLRKVFRAEDIEGLVRTKNERTLYELADQSMIWTDMDACEAAMQEAERLGHTSAEGCCLLETAQTYFARGRLFEGEDGLWCHAKRDMFETAQYRCILWLSEAYEAQGNLRQAETQIEKLLHRDPLDEAALTRLLLLLHKQGMTAEAIRRYKSATALFASQGTLLPPSLEILARQLTGESQIRALPSDLPVRSALLPTSSILLFPASVIQPDKSLETTVPDCAVQSGIVLAHIVTLIQQWYGMAMFSHDLQNHLDQEIKKLDAFKSRYPLEACTFSRRSILFALAALPATWLLSRKQTHKLALELEEFLPQCAASITACWHLSKGNHLETIPCIIDAYLPTLTAVLRNASLHREMTADLIAQCYLLKSILAWHLESLSTAQTYCIQAMEYSVIAKNKNLQLTALNQHALIFYYAKQFQRALATSEEAYATLQQASHHHTFAIMQGRVYMYLAAFQAQQSKGDAEQTLALAQNAFALQASAAEPIPPYVDCGTASLTLWDGLTHYHLGMRDVTHGGRALASLKMFGQLQPSPDIPERFRLECVTNRTLAAIQAGEMEEAVDCFTAGKQGAHLLQSNQRTAEIEYAYQELTGRWPKEKRVQTLRVSPEEVLLNTEER